MKLLKFEARDFRNIEYCDISFSDGVNLLYGKNAQGKTNAVEGIYIFSRGKSFRGREDSELIRFGCEGFRIYIEYEDKNSKGSLEYILHGKERRRKKNGYQIFKVTEMIGNFKSVLFYPDDLRLVKGGPEERRNFLNIAVSQIYPTYMKIYSDYKKALENRNCALKFINKGFPVSREEIESWSEILAEYASHIYIMREEYIKDLSFYSARIMSDISSGKEEIIVENECDIETGLTDRKKIKELYKEKFSSDTAREIAAGVSLYGPHRDDISIKINGRDARLYASQGQQRSVVLAFKLAEGDIINERCGEYPVFLFDDVLSELDDSRRRYVLEGAKEKQFIITSCEPEELIGYTNNEIDVFGGNYVLSHRKR